MCANLNTSLSAIACLAATPRICLRRAPQHRIGPASEFPYDELLASSNPLKAAAQKAKLHAEKDIILHVLQVCNNDFAEAARMLNIGLSSLYRKLKEIQ